MSTEQAEKASPATTRRLGFGACVGIVIMLLAVVLLVTADSPREVVSSCVPLLVGAQLMLPVGEWNSRAVRMVRTALLAVAVVLIVVGIAVL